MSKTLITAIVTYLFAIGAVLPWPAKETFHILFLIATVSAVAIALSCLVAVDEVVNRSIEDYEEVPEDKGDAKNLNRNITIFYLPLVILAAVGQYVFAAIAWAFVLAIFLAMGTKVKERMEAQNKLKTE